MAWELIPCIWYRSASSHQASASVGKASRNPTSAEIAAVCWDMDFKSAIRRFVTGCRSSQLQFQYSDLCFFLIRTTLTGLSARIFSYSWRIFAKSLWLTAIASWYKPRNAIIRSLAGPNRLVSRSKQMCADLSSPVLRQARSNCSYFVHSSGLSGAANRDLGNWACRAGWFCRKVGACCESRRASPGPEELRILCEWSRDEGMLSERLAAIPSNLGRVTSR